MRYAYGTTPWILFFWRVALLSSLKLPEGSHLSSGSPIFDREHHEGIGFQEMERCRQFIPLFAWFITIFLFQGEIDFT